jgi:hypothetical protein
MNWDEMTPEGIDSGTRYRERSERTRKKKKKRKKEGFGEREREGQEEWWRKREEVRHRGCS